MAIKNDGTSAQDAFIRRKNAQPNTWVERFRDARDLRGINGGRPVGDFAKPSDFLVTESGRHYYCEVKSVQSAVSFPFSNIEKGQRAMALKQAVIGGPYYFYLFSFGLGEWFIMDAVSFKNAIDAGKASIKFKELPKWNHS